ncbi:MAG: hypothetical protein SNJ55_12625 [Chloroherpetonaceae bacterium]
MPTFHDEELALLSNPRFFEQKLQATEKLKQLMEEIRLVLLEEIRPEELLAPSTTDFLKGQIAKGENYEGYPYVMLDFPKQFDKENIFTFRTLFWYGHALIFSVIVAGTYLETYRQNVERHYERLCEARLYFGIDDVWDWRDSAARLLTKEEKTHLLARHQPFIKLMKRLSPDVLSDKGKVLNEAKLFYQTVKPVLQK